MGVIDRYYGDAIRKLVALGQIICAICGGASLVSISGGSHNFVECYKEYLGSGYTKRLLDYPTFIVRLLKRRLRKTAFTVFGTLDTFLMKEFVATRLKGAEHCDWMQSRQSFWMAIEKGNLSLPGLMDIISNFMGVWPLIVCYLKEAGMKDSGYKLVVCPFLVALIFAWFPLLIFVFLFRKNK